MRYTEIVAASALVATAAARANVNSSPLSSRMHARDMKLSRREVPQEQSHKPILVKTQEMLLLDNPNEIVDSVFGLLGNAAASEGAGLITDFGTQQSLCLSRLIANFCSQTAYSKPRLTKHSPTLLQPVTSKARSLLCSTVHWSVTPVKSALPRSTALACRP
jgi:hypothetical protein